MNAVNLYVSTASLVFEDDLEESASWTDLYKLIPYLRQSLSCTVCCNLLIEPFTPTESNCQHHVCKTCKGGKKTLKPSCSWCKDYSKYFENVSLRTLLQCYKALCQYIENSPIYRRLICNNTSTAVPSVVGPSLTELIHEGSGFKDEFNGQEGSTKNSFNFMPKLYSSTSTQTRNLSAASSPVKVEDLSLTSNRDTNQIPNDTLQTTIESDSIDVHNTSNHNSVYQVDLVYSQMDIHPELVDSNATDVAVVDIPIIDVPEKLAVESDLEAHSNAQVQSSSSSRRRWRSGPSRLSKSLRSAARTGPSTTTTAPPPPPTKHGCRCGVASALPGKLTCCGQRCPCYIERKACLECKCRGCRNPHTLDGHKISYPVVSNGLQLNTLAGTSTIGSEESSLMNNSSVLVVGMCTTQFNNVSPNSTGIILDKNSVVTTDHDDENQLTLQL